MLIAEITLGNFDPPWLWVTIGAVSLATIVFTYRRMFARSGRALTWALMGARCLGVLVLLLALIKPAWTRFEERERLPTLAVLLDDSQSMSLPHATDAASRYGAAGEWLAAGDKALRKRFDLQYFNLAGERLGLDELPAEPAAEQTDLVRALRVLGNRLRGRSAAGILLLSDGRDTTSRQDYLAMRDNPVPVYCLGFQSLPATTRGTADLAVVSVNAPDKVLVHNTVQIEALIRKEGGPPLEVPVQIERGGIPLMTQDVTLPAGRSDTIVRLNYTPTEPGDFVLAARVPVAPGELSARNNERLFRLRVEATPIRVLYIEGVLRPESSFLRNALERDPDVDLVAFVRAASPNQAGGQGAMMGRELITAERMKKIDAVLLGDFEADMLDDNTYRLLRDWVAEGGGLIVAGGYHSLGRNGLVRTPLNEVLPVEPADGAQDQIEEPFVFRFTPEGRLHPVAGITGDAVRDAALWESLPKLAGITAVKRARPAATVLARHPRRNPEGDDGYIVLSVQPYGRGRAMVFTADTTWRWSRVARLRGQPDSLYARFWSQIVRYLAQRDTPEDRTALTVATDAPEYDRGRQVVVHVRRNPAVMIPGDDEGDAEVEITVRSPDGRQAVLPVQQETADANGWNAPFFPDRGGRYQVTARLVRADAGGRHERAAQVTEFIVRGSDLELEDPTTNPAALAQIARLSGGLYAALGDAHDVEQLMEAIPSQPTVTRQKVTAETWNSPLLFLVFLGLVTTEWIVRRRNQLV